MKLLKVCIGFVPALMLVIAPLSQAQDGYPSKPIRMMVPWAAGNLTDVIARMLAEKLSKSMGQQVWVENKGGASGLQGMEALSKAPPDGYTIGISASGPLAVNPALYPKLPYDPLRDFAPISMLWSGPMVLLVDSGSSLKTVRDIVDRSKSSPGGLDYASPGNGTAQNITGELLKGASGARLNHIPHKGSGQSISNVLGGHIPIVFETLAVALPHIRSGKLRPIAIGSAERSDLLPGVPTIAESGYPTVLTDAWICLIAPAGIPIAIQQRLNAEIRKILDAPETQSWAAGQGGTIIASTPDELGKYMQSEIGRLGDIIRSAGIRLN